MDKKIKIVIISISIAVFTLLFHFTFQGLIFPQNNLVTNLHFGESKYYTVSYGGILNLDRANYVYPNDRLSYLVVLNKKTTVGQIYINASMQYIVGHTIAETYDFGYLPLGGSAVNYVQYEYPFSAREEGTNEIRLILNIFDSNGKPIDWAVEDTPFQVLSTTDKLQSDLVTATGILAVGTIVIGAVTIITLIQTNRTHKKQIETTDKQNKISALMEIFKTLGENENRNARRVLYKTKRDYSSSNDIGVFKIRTNYQQVSSVASIFNQIGSLIEKNIIPKEEFLDLYADTTILCWLSLKEHIENEQKIRKNKFYMDHFVWLGEQSITYWKKNRSEEELPDPLNTSLLD